MQPMSYLRLIVLFFAAFCVALPARAGLLRDADIEHQLRRLATPVLQAAGLSPDIVKVLVVDDNRMNAYVLDNGHIFLHSGLILKMKTPAMLQAVIAHEAAHISHGHIAQGAGETGPLRNAAALGMAVAAATAASTGNTGLGVGIALGANSSAQRVGFGYTRVKESSADQSAIRYLAQAGVPLTGAQDLFDLFDGQELLLRDRQDLYIRTHPFSRDRARAIDRLIIGTKPKTHTAETLAQDAAALDRIKLKLVGFLRPSNQLQSLALQQDTAQLRAIGQALLAYRQANTDGAIEHMTMALNLSPDDAYLWDLLAEFQLRHGDADAAVKTYTRAAQLAPSNAIILAGLGRAYAASNNPSQAIEAIERALSADPALSYGLQELSRAYDQYENPAMASATTALRYAVQGRRKDALIHAKRAMEQAPAGSRAWQRALDVVDSLKQS